MNEVSFCIQPTGDDSAQCTFKFLFPVQFQLFRYYGPNGFTFPHLRVAQCCTQRYRLINNNNNNMFMYRYSIVYIMF